MAIKLDQQKTKQQLLQISISLAIVLICMSYMQYNRNWSRIGKFWDSLIIPFMFTGEILKVILSKYCGRKDKDTITHRQKQKKNYFSSNEIFCGFLMQFLCMMFYVFICILLGAPLLQDYEQTFVLSVVLTLLTVSPTVFLIGAGGALQVCFCDKADLLKSEETTIHIFKYSAGGAIIGAWAGSIVAPLDWDRDWQLYPIPNIVGAILGFGLANIWLCSKVLYNTGRIYLLKKRI